MSESQKSLRNFIKSLEKEGDLKKIAAEADLNLEITEISHRVLHSQGGALLFENPIRIDGEISETPVLTNLFGTKERVAKGLGLKKVEDIRKLGEMLAFLKQPDPPKGFKEATEFVKNGIKTITKMKPKNVSKAPCQEVVIEGDDVDLNIFPIQKCWEGDVSPLITWPLVVTKGPDKKDKQDNYNLGIYRMQPLLDEETGKSNKAIMRWLHHRGGAQHHKRWKDKKAEPLPVAAVLGADPATTLSAVTPIPDNVSEYEFAGLLKDSPVELVDCKTIPLKVPANAEIVIEGYVSLDEYADEGPFGDHTGFYNSVEQFPVFNITAITHRKNPIYHSTYTGKPPDECSVLGEALNELFIPLVQQQYPEIIDFYLPPEACSYRVGVISIKKAYAGHAKRIMMGAWSYLRQFMYTKYLIIVDEDINCRDWKEVIWAISVNTDPARDLTVLENTPIDYLDFASEESGLSGKLAIDATTKVYPETKREWGEEISQNQEIIDKVTRRWKEYGFE